MLTLFRLPDVTTLALSRSQHHRLALQLLPLHTQRNRRHIPLPLRPTTAALELSALTRLTNVACVMEGQYFSSFNAR